MQRGTTAWLLRAVFGVVALSCSEPTEPAAPAGSGIIGGGAAVTEGVGLHRRLRRLSNREYDRVVGDLLGDVTRPATGFVADLYPNGYDNGSAGLAVQSDQVADYETAAEALAANAVQTRLSRLTGGCDPTAQQDPAACLEPLLSTFAARAYRRPLTDPEKQRLRSVFALDIPNGFPRAVQTVLEVILQSPQFLYREELGASDQQGSPGSSLTLTDYEVASELSFLLTGSIPDDVLWSAVSAGRFSTPQDRAREARRLLATPGARDTLRAFLHQWMTTDRLATISKDPGIYPSFDAPLASSMRSELDRFYDQVLWNGTGSLRELFTTSEAFVDPALADVYGVPLASPFAPGSPGRAVGLVSASGPRGDALMRPVTLDATRPGILTRAGFLAVHSDEDSSGPIARGVFVLTSILCTPPPPRPPSVPAAPPPMDPSVQGLTTRQRFAQHVRDAECASCHDRIDGLGFGFEEFDGLGAYRTTENGQPIDASGNVIGSGEIDGPFEGAAELATRIAGSRLLSECYARQAYRYAMGAVEASSEDLGWLFAASTPDANMTAALLAIVENPIFVTRSFE